MNLTYFEVCLEMPESSLQHSCYLPTDKFVTRELCSCTLLSIYSLHLVFVSARGNGAET